MTNSRTIKGQIGRFLSLLIAFIMALSLVPVVAMGDTYPEIELFSAHHPGRLVSVSSGWNQNAAICNNGHLWTWGVNAQGQLGHGNTDNADRITRVESALGGWTAVSVGQTHMVGIRAGHLYAWGSRAGGRLGIPGSGNITVPTRIPNTPGVWESVSASTDFSFAIRDDGTLWGWGNQLSGRLGNGVSSNLVLTVPTRIGSASNWASVSAGSDHVVALRTNSSNEMLMYAWGVGMFGRVGDGTTTMRPTPTAIGREAAHANHHWLSVSAGEGFSVALRSDNTIWSWGMAARTGTGLSEVLRPTPIDHPNAYNWSHVSVGAQHTIAVRDDGTLWAWGMGGNGRLGDGTTTARPRPVRICTCGIRNCDINVCQDVQSITNWQSAIGGTAHTMALKDDGTLWSWGANGFGQLGRGTSRLDTLWPVLILSESTSIRVPAGGAEIYNPGRSLALQALGRGTTGRYHEKASVTWQSSIPAIAMVNINGVVRARSQGETTITATPINGGPTTSITLTVGAGEPDIDPRISAGNRFALHVSNSGHLGSWGVNTRGRLGRGPIGTVAQNEIEQYRRVGDENWYMVSAGELHSLAIHQDGRLFAWGSNQNGRLGNGIVANVNTLTPIPIATQSQHAGYTWNYVAAGFDFSAAIRSDGTLWTWGQRHPSPSRLGFNSATHVTIPTRVGAVATWESLSAGREHTLAIRTDGTLWAWGHGGQGRLGRGNTNHSITPTRVGGHSDWISVSAGNQHSVGIRGDRSNREAGGTLWAWGSPIHGQLGNGETSGAFNSPVQITAAGVSNNGWLQASAGGAHTLAVCVNGTMWAWGNRFNGRIGNDNIPPNENHSRPVQIGMPPYWEGERWMGVSAGTDHSTAVSYNETRGWEAWHWGVHAPIPTEVGVVPVTGITLDVPAVQTQVPRILESTVIPLNATDRNVSWRVGDSAPNYVRIEPYTGGGETVYIFISDRDRTAFTDPFPVPVVATVANGRRTGMPVTVEFEIMVTRDAVCGVSLSVEPSPLDIMVGDDPYRLRATIEPPYASNQNVEWSISNPAVAIVDRNSGYVTARAAGIATITARLYCACHDSLMPGCAGYLTYTITVNVTEPPPAEPILRYLHAAPLLENGDAHPTILPVQLIESQGEQHVFTLPSLPYYVHSLDIDAEALEPDASMIGGTGRHPLGEGENIFPITVTTDLGSVVYQIIVIRETRDPSNTLALLDVGAMLIPAFDPFVTNYRVAVPADRNSVTITAIPHDRNVTVQVGGVNVGLGGGSRSYTLTGTVNTIQIVLFRGSTSVKTYTVVINRAPPCADVSLHTLRVRDENNNALIMVPPFTPGLFSDTHMINVPHDTGAVTIEATVGDYAEIEFDSTNWHNHLNDLVSLDIGHNEFELTVTAENGDYQIYTIIINRASAEYNNDASLSVLHITPGTLNPSFHPADLNYTVFLPYGETEVIITAIPNCGAAEVFGSTGRLEIRPGNNIFRIVVVAEDGIATMTYTVTVVRSRGDSDTSLSSLRLTVDSEDVFLTPPFHTDIRRYDAQVDEDVMSIIVSATTTSNYAAFIAGTGSIPLEPGLNVRRVVVRAGDGTLGFHYIYVWRASGDATLYSLEVYPGELTPDFEREGQILYDVSLLAEPSIFITAIPNCELATVTGDGLHTLDIGMNHLFIDVVADNPFITRRYTIRVDNRGLLDCAILEDIELSHGYLYPDFDGDNETEYTVNVSGITSIHINPITRCDDATVLEGYGDHDLVEGSNFIEIVVQAQDGVTEKTYTVEVILAPLLYSLTVITHNEDDEKVDSEELILPGTLNPERVFNVTVPHYVTAVYIDMVAYDAPPATSISGAGRQTLREYDADEPFVVVVTHENGEPVLFRVIVHREGRIPPNNTLAFLGVEPGNLHPAFSPQEQNYTVTVPYDTTSITITADAVDPDVTVYGYGPHDLDLAVNPQEFLIGLYRDNEGIVNTYTVVVYRSPLCPDISLYSLSVYSATDTFLLLPPFAPGVILYTVYVPYGTDSVTVTATAESLYAQINGSGERSLSIPVTDLELGPNEFELTVRAQNEDEQIYTIIIIVTDAEPPLLAELNVTPGELEPDFDPAETRYVVYVPYETYEITITASAKCPNANLLGYLGTHDFDDDSYEFFVTVEAQDGALLTYTIVVRRLPPEECDNATLSELSVYAGTPLDLFPAFSPDVLSYEVSVAYYVEEVSVAAEAASDVAQILTNLSDPFQVSPGTTTIEVVVQAEDGTEVTYEILVVRPLLRSLIVRMYDEDDDEVDMEELIPPGNPERVFDLTVPHYVTEVYIEALGADATVDIVAIIGRRPLQPGADNVFRVGFAGHDVEYRINITREYPTPHTLGFLGISPGELDPIFDPFVFEYTVNVPMDVTFVSVTAIPSSPLLETRRDVTFTHDLQPGLNEIVINLYYDGEPDPVDTHYTIIVYQSLDVSLHDLRVFDEDDNDFLLSPAFPGAFSDTYTVSVPYYTDTVTIYARVCDDAEIVGTGGESYISVTVNLGPVGPDPVTYTMVITVRAEDGNEQPYTIIINRPPVDVCNIARLAMLRVDPGGVLNPSFSPTTTDYRVYVAYEIDQVEIYARPESPDVQAVFGAGGPFPIGVGGNTFHIDVIAEDGTEKRYTVTVTRRRDGDPCNDTRLSSLSVDPPGVPPLSFSPEVRTYGFAVPYTVTEISVYAEEYSPYAEILSGTGSHPLPVGLNTITVVVRAQCPEADLGLHVITVYRADRDIGIDASLSSLRAIPGILEPGFDPDNLPSPLEFNVRVQHAQSITIEAITNCPHASIVSGGGTHVLDSGWTTFDVIVRAEAPRVPWRTYTVIVFNCHGCCEEPGDTARLADLILSHGALSPRFDGDRYMNYTTLVSGISEIYVTPVPRCPEATVVYGRGSHPLAYGWNDILIRVVGKDGFVLDYWLQVHRGNHPVLNELSVTPYMGNTGDVQLQEIVLMPPGSPTREFIVPVDSVVTYVTINPVTGSTGTVTVTRYPDGEPNLPRHSLVDGENIFVVTVSLNNGATNDYTIIVYRRGIICDYDTLRYLDVVPGELEPDFDRQLTTYTMSFTDATTSITITATPYDIEVTMTINDTPVGAGVPHEHPLVVGDNEIVIRLFRDGIEVNAYTIDVYVVCRSTLCDDVSLYDLNVSGATETFSLSPRFVRGVFVATYTVFVPHDTDSVTIDATAEGSNAQINGTGERTISLPIPLDPGPSRTVQTLTVTAENEIDEQIYTIIIYRLGDGGGLPILSDLQVDPGNLRPAFEYFETGYTVIVDYEVHEIEITATALCHYADVSFAPVVPIAVNDNVSVGVFPLEVGENEITITVVAKCGIATMTYTVTVIRCDGDEPPITDRLRNLDVTPGTLEPDFAPRTNRYTVTVLHETASVEITAIPYDYPDVTIVGDGTRPLGYGSNEIEIHLYRGGDRINTYTVIVFRPPVPGLTCCGSPFLSALDVNPGTLEPMFNAATFSYTVYVPYETDEITITATAVCSEAEVAFDGVVQTTAGNNVFIRTFPLVADNYEFEVTVSAECGIASEMYLVTVIRLPYDGICIYDTLSSLVVTPGQLYPGFEPDRTEYTLDVSCNVGSVFITATPYDDDPDVTITINGISVPVGEEHEVTLGVGETKIEIRLYRDGEPINIYTITVYREECECTGLETLGVFRGDHEYPLSPLFPSGFFFYTTEVPSTTDVVEIRATASDNATVTGDGEFRLDPGHNVRDVVVTAENGDVQTYTVEIFRGPIADNNRLGLLSVSGEWPVVLNPRFDPDDGIRTYSITVLDDVTDVNVVAIPNDPAVTAIVTGAPRLGADPHIIMIGLYRAGRRVNTYTIAVNRTDVCDDAYLRTLIVSSEIADSFTMSPPFYRGTVLEYTVINVPNETEYVTIAATASDRATVTGYGLVPLPNEGRNEREIRVEAENGDVRVYTIAIYRNPPGSGNSFLADILVNPGSLTPGFVTGRTEYEVFVGYDTTSITITAVTECDYAAVEFFNDVPATALGNNEFTATLPLNVVGSKGITITVVPEVGPNRYYTVMVERLGDGGLLIYLGVDRGTLTPTFAPRTFVYTVTVPHYVEEIYVSYEVASPNARVLFGAGLIDLEAWPNTITRTRLMVLNESNASWATYDIVVIRTPNNDATLGSLSVDPGSLYQPFVQGSRDTYDVIFDSVETGITITAAPNCNLARIVTGDGFRALLPGVVNYLEIEVEAQDLTRMTYTIRVENAITQYSDDATLYSLTVSPGELAPAFVRNPAEPNPSFEVRLVNEQYITITPVLNCPHATIVSAPVNPVPLEPGWNRPYFEIIVEAENGDQRTYTIRVYNSDGTTPPDCDDARLLSLSVRDWALYPDFDPDVETYSVYVFGIERVYVSAETYSDYAIIDSGTGYSGRLEPGDNTITVTVRAQDGTLMEYTINVYLHTTPPEFDITVIGGRSEPAQQALMGDTVYLFADPRPDGYVFGGWLSGDVAIINPDFSQGASFIMPARDVTVRVYWERIPDGDYYLIEIEDGGIGYTVSARFAEPGTTVTVTAGVRDGYDFGDWTLFSTTQPALQFDITAGLVGTFEMPAADVTVTGNWIAWPEVTFDATYGEFIDPTDPAEPNILIHRFRPGTVLTRSDLPMAPSMYAPEHHVFGGWKDADNRRIGEDEHTVTLTGDITLRAIWVEAPPFMVGDVNMSDSVTSADATMLARYIASRDRTIFTPDIFCPFAADVDGDGFITQDDLVLLARWLVGHNVTNQVARNGNNNSR